MPTRARYDVKKPKLSNLVMTEEQKTKIKALTSSSSNSDKFIEALNSIYADFMVWSSVDKPSSTEKKFAAEEIARDIARLRRKLSGEAGGLKYRFNLVLSKTNRKITQLKDLNDGLKELENECVRYIRNYDQNQLPEPLKKPKHIFAEELAVLFNEVLNERAREYIPPDLSVQFPVDNRGGKFARMLVVMFNSEQSLKNIIKSALKK